MQNLLTTSRPHVVRLEGKDRPGLARGEDELDLACGAIIVNVHHRSDIAVRTLDRKWGRTRLKATPVHGYFSGAAMTPPAV
jgi:hypothetical protein